MPAASSQCADEAVLVPDDETDVLGVIRQLGECLKYRDLALPSGVREMLGRHYES
jgi:hypothetical protein